MSKEKAIELLEEAKIKGDIKIRLYCFQQLSIRKCYLLKTELFDQALAELRKPKCQTCENTKEVAKYHGPVTKDNVQFVEKIERLPCPDCQEPQKKNGGCFGEYEEEKPGEDERLDDEVIQPSLYHLATKKHKREFDALEAEVKKLKEKPEPSEFTKVARKLIDECTHGKHTNVIGGNLLLIRLDQACDIIDRQAKEIEGLKATIQRTIELMDDEPARKHLEQVLKD